MLWSLTVIENIKSVKSVAYMHSMAVDDDGDDQHIAPKYMPS